MQGTGISVGVARGCAIPIPTPPVPRLEDIFSVAVVRGKLVEEHRLGMLDLSGVDRRGRLERSVLLVGETGGVLENHVRPPRRGEAFLGNGAVQPPVTEVPVLRHVLRVCLAGARGGAFIELDGREPHRCAIAVDELDHVATGLRDRHRRFRGAGSS